ncbi:MAG TPA: uroporphyrinogen-III C-methyltransferase [Chitinophagales bacterium]|nr:uroporphyrinogen-III C-methyltransferase [Chitinophagales bacterium]
MKKQPQLTLVGAGPGDPDLISIKGLNALKAADVVLYDALVSPELLAHAPNALTVFVGKRAGHHEMPQQEINRLIVEYALQYGHVVRLKGGDPFVFGRGHEEIEHAGKFGIATEVIPGISSATGIPGLHKIPLTRRGVTESFWVITGTTLEGTLSGDVEHAARSHATVVILMGLSRLTEIVQVFKDAGKSQLPVAVIQNGSLPDEKTALGTIETIESEVKEKGLKAPAVIIIGEVVKLAPEFNLLKEKLYLI